MFRTALYFSVFIAAAVYWHPCFLNLVCEIRSQSVLSLELPQVRLKTLGHRVGVDAGDVPVILMVDDLAEIALALLPGHAIVKNRKAVSARLALMIVLMSPRTSVIFEPVAP